MQIKNNIYFWLRFGLVNIINVYLRLELRVVLEEGNFLLYMRINQPVNQNLIYYRILEIKIKGFFKNIYSFYWIFVTASKPKTKRNKTCFSLYASNSPPLNSLAKDKTSFNFFSTLGLIVSIKNIKQNIWENIVKVYETSINI